MISPERASLVLFKAYPLWDVETVREKAFYSNDKLIKYGLVFNEALSPVEDKVLEDVLAIYPRDRFHATFWSFNDTIKHEKEGTRILHQLIHYFSTYGLEFLGLKSSPYIPNEAYKDTFEGFIKERLVIDALGVKEIKTKVVNLLNTPVGLSEQQRNATLSLVRELLSRGKITSEEILSAKNRDLLSLLLSVLEIPIEDFEVLIRYILGKYNLRKIKSKNVLRLLSLEAQLPLEVEKFILKDENGKLLESLAETYYRNKEYVLALKTNPNSSGILKKFVNKARRLAKKYYKPTPQAHILSHSWREYKNLVSSSKLPQLVRFYTYFIKRELDTGLFFIRNGSVWYEEDWIPFKKSIEDLEPYKMHLEEEIERRVQKVFSGVVLNRDCRVALPTSASNFLGNIPMYSSFSVLGRNEVGQIAIGIHWKNFRGERVDLDLHLYDAIKNIRLGWNSSWYGGCITFSGDMIDAPEPYGASEYMCIDYYDLEEDPKIIFEIYDYGQNVFDEDDFMFSLVVLEGATEREEILESIKGEHFKFSIPMKFNKTKPSIILGILAGRDYYFVPISRSKLNVMSRNGILKDMLESFVMLAESWPTLQGFGVKTSPEEGLKFQDLTIELFDNYWNA